MDPSWPPQGTSSFGKRLKRQAKRLISLGMIAAQKEVRPADYTRRVPHLSSLSCQSLTSSYHPGVNNLISVRGITIERSGFLKKGSNKVHGSKEPHPLWRLLSFVVIVIGVIFVSLALVAEIIFQSRLGR